VFPKWYSPSVDGFRFDAAAILPSFYSGKLLSAPWAGSLDSSALVQAAAALRSLVAGKFRTLIAPGGKPLFFHSTRFNMLFVSRSELFRNNGCGG
jgi:hypothetical protein